MSLSLSQGNIKKKEKDKRMKYEKYSHDVSAIQLTRHCTPIKEAGR